MRNITIYTSIPVKDNQISLKAYNQKHKLVYYNPDFTKNFLDVDEKGDDKGDFNVNNIINTEKT